jgi:hypothetical protein
VDRRDEDVARQVVAELHDELREVGLPRGDPLGRERLVEPDLLGRHRLDLDDLVDAVRCRHLGDDAAGLLGVPGPVDDRSGGGQRLLEPDEVLVEVEQDIVLDGRAGEPQLLPVLDLADDRGPLGADRRRRVGEVAAELGVRQGFPGRGREGRHTDEGRRHRPSSSGSTWTRLGSPAV